MTSLTAWDRVQLARHPARPHTLDYIAELIEDPQELHGDRLFRDDPAIVAVLGRFRGQPILVLGHQKGTTTAENIARNFGMPRPEGYRKAIRVMQLAEKFRLPVLTFVDTPAADPGLESEERGQGWEWWSARAGDLRSAADAGKRDFRRRITRSLRRDPLA